MSGNDDTVVPVLWDYRVQRMLRVCWAKQGPSGRQPSCLYLPGSPSTRHLVSLDCCGLPVGLLYLFHADVFGSDPNSLRQPVWGYPNGHNTKYTVPISVELNVNGFRSKAQFTLTDKHIITLASVSMDDCTIM